MSSDSVIVDDMEAKNEKKGSNFKYMCTNLPSDLWTNHILPALRVKTLLRFRSVCKLWRDTIDQPCFVSNHFALSKNNLDKNQLKANEKFETRFKINYTWTVRHRDTMSTQAYLYRQPDTYYFQVSCNGLFLLRTWTLRLILWNPSIRKSLSLPRCPFASSSPQVQIKYFFGFRPSRNDYVVYAFQIDNYRRKEFSVAVYTLSDNLWNIRDYKLSLPIWLFAHRRCRTMCGNESVFLDRAFHWFGRDPDYKSHPRRKTHLVSFDFDVEKFSYLELPDSSDQALKPLLTYRFLFVLGESLAIFNISSTSSSIWVLKNKLWNLLFSGTSCSNGFNYINRHHHVVTKIFYAEDGGITMVYGRVGYKIMSDEIKELNKSVSPNYLILDTYVESLVLKNVRFNE